jgi:hypothetical protein
MAFQSLGGETCTSFSLAFTREENQLLSMAYLDGRTSFEQQIEKMRVLLM